MIRFPIRIEEGGEGTAFGVVVPDLPGCFSAVDPLHEGSRSASMNIASVPVPSPSTGRAAVALSLFLSWFATGAAPAAADPALASPRCFDIDRDRSPSHRDIAEPFDLEVNHRQRLADCRARLPTADASASAALHLTMARYHYLLDEPVAMQTELLKAVRYGSLEARYWRAIGLMASGDLQHVATGRTMLERAADDGSPHANMLLGAEHASELPKGADGCRRAVAEHRVAAGGGLSEAHYYLGTFHLLGNCLEKDTRKAVSHLSRVTGPLADTARFAVALTSIGSENAATVAAGLRQLELLADGGFQMARVQLVTIYFIYFIYFGEAEDDFAGAGYLVPRDPDKARKHYCLLDDTFRSIAKINIGDAVDQWRCEDPL